MSHQSMSINQMLQQPKEDTSYDIEENKLLAKVKVFYTFKGSDTHCLCSFNTQFFENIKDKDWVSIPLKQCLLSVCSSSPDQLMNSNTAVYSANFEESVTVDNWTPLHDSSSNIIWEGHGLLSSILSDDDCQMQVTGKIADRTKSGQCGCRVEVLIQLHHIRQPPATISKDQCLPPMRSIWIEPTNNNSNTNNHNSNKNISSSDTNDTNSRYSPTSNTKNLSLSPLLIDPSRQLSPHQQFHEPQFQKTFMQHRDDSSQQLPHLNSSSPLSKDPVKDEYQYNRVYPPAMNPEWPGCRYDSNSFDSERLKRQKLSGSYSQNSSSTNNTPLYHDIHNLSPSRNKNNIVSTNNSGEPHGNNSNILHRPSTLSSLKSITSTTVSKLSSVSKTDTYYHQSRRKKRDTKPPNANDIRPFVAVEKAKDGQYLLPAEVDSWTVLNLGTVVWDRPAFHNQRYIYPVGYRVKKWYRSMVDPHSDTQYTCEILDGGDEPIFQLNADDNPSECWRGPTPTTVWTIAVRRAFAIRNMDYGHNPVGPDFFGLRKNTIAKMIQDLTNADKCKNYIWQNFEAMNNNKGKSIRRSNTRLNSSSSTSSLTAAEQKLIIVEEDSISSSHSSVKSEETA